MMSISTAPLDQPYSSESLLTRLGIVLSPHGQAQRLAGSLPIDGRVCDLLSASFPEGQRRTNLLKVAGRYIGLGLQREEVRRICQDWALRQHPSMDEDEVNDVVDDLFDKHV